MRKLLFVAVLFVMIVWAAQPLLMLSPEDGGKSNYRTLGSHRINNLPPRYDFKSFLKNSKDISTANWEVQYHNYDFYYYMPRPVGDTQATRFHPPTECSLVAFTVIHYNTTTGQVGQPYYLFVADQRMDVDYDTLVVVYPPESPWGTKFPGYENILSYAKDNGVWDTIQTAIYIPYDGSKSHDFFCGYTPGTNNFAILSTNYVPCSSPGESHSWRFRNAYGYYYNYYFSDNTKLEFGISAYIRALRNLPPKLDIDFLPNTYNTGNVVLYAVGTDFGVPTESTGIAQAFVEYDINGTPGTPIQMSLVVGDSSYGVWSCYLPPANPGDNVTYRGIAIDYQGLSDTTEWWTYTIKAGTSDHFLYVKGNGDAIFDDYIENNWACDVWDIAVDGAPDGSVFDFYTPTKGPGKPVVVWKGWGETPLSYRTYGSGVGHTGDTAYIAQIIDAGGSFWLEDQDGLYGCDNETWHDYGQHNAVTNSFVHRYFGIVTATDDGTWAGQRNYALYGDETDPVIGEMFTGTIGLQTTAGSIMHGSMAGDTAGSREWAGSFDAYESYVVPEMSAEDGTVMALRNENAPSGTGTGKAIFHIVGSSWLTDPNDPIHTYDQVASDSLQDLYLHWLTGIKEQRPDVKVIEISNPRIRGQEVLMNVTIPYRANLKVLVHDISGRVLGKAFDGEAVGLRTISYNTSRINSGTYFLSVYVNGELKGARKFILVK
uniref:Uncharacterized protein n=1 Tax=candidate division WOR-3 bacterium TaxID=2052148 RepID=A0A7C4Y6G2_UNCW3